MGNTFSSYIENKIADKFKLYFCTHRRQIQDKNVDILRAKRVFKVRKKKFSSFLKGFQLSKFVSDPRVHL